MCVCVSLCVDRVMDVLQYMPVSGWVGGLAV